jgi:hypothetical protein
VLVMGLGWRQDELPSEKRKRMTAAALAFIWLEELAGRLDKSRGLETVLLELAGNLPGWFKELDAARPARERTTSRLRRARTALLKAAGHQDVVEALRGCSKAGRGLYPSVLDVPYSADEGTSLGRFSAMRTLGAVLLVACATGCERSPQPAPTALASATPSSTTSAAKPPAASSAGEPQVASSVSRSPVGSAAAASSSAPAASGRAAGGATIAGIDARCAPAEKLAREATSADQIFANVQSTDMDPGTWQRFTSDADLKRKTKDKFVYDGAAVWRARNAWTLVAMTLSSPSGDWVQFVDYCYRPTGTLAKREATLNTFVTGDEVDDGVSRLRTTYVGANGRVLAQRAKVRNLKTLKPAPGRQFMQNDEPEYLTISQLPFAGLLRRAGVPASR